MLVGQAPGIHETIKGRPFVGPSGRELDRWLYSAGIHRHEIALTNVWDTEIPQGGLETMTTTLTLARKEGWYRPDLQIQAHRYLRPEWWAGPLRLRHEITSTNPNIVVALGNEALWALSGTFGMVARRGTLFRVDLGVKALATYHPSYILRGGYRSRLLAIADLRKARNESESPEMSIPKRKLYISPTLDEIDDFCRNELPSAITIAIDIETAYGEITSIAFATSNTCAICIPFVVDKRSYWATLEEEVAAWRVVKDICESNKPKVLQNGTYDLSWLWVKRGIAVRNYLHDTRLMHHALYPELPKSLGFMATLWENEVSWKSWAQRHAEKRDD